MTEATTWRDVAITQQEIALMRSLLSHLEAASGFVGSRHRAVLTQIMARWEANDATEVTL